MHRRSAELTGLALGMLGLALLVALATYDPRDPSLNTATSRHPANLAGPVGAVAADLLLQGFGLAGASMRWWLGGSAPRRSRAGGEAM
jgi:S-DNA-T family DNA segregation ATPase FtsK/SpoIIIE